MTRPLIRQEVFPYKVNMHLLFLMLGAVDSLNFTLLGVAGYGPAFKCALSGDRAYVSAGATIMCFDVSNPDTGLLLGYLHTHADIWGLFVRNDTVFAAGGGEGFLIVDFSNPALPKLVCQFRTGSHVNGVWLDRDRAYLTQHQNFGISGLVILDISNPSSPDTLGTYATGNIFQAGAGCRVRGDTAFVAFAAVADSVGSLKILDVSDPANISLIASFDTAVSAQDLALNGDTLYLADYNNGLLVVDISDPTNPQQIGRFKRQGAPGLSYTMDVECQGDTVYIVDGFVWAFANPSMTFIVLDCSQPDNIQVLSGCNTRDFAWGLALGDGMAIVADEWGGLLNIDISSADTAFIRARWRTGSYAQDVVYADGFAYVAAEAGGVRVHTIGDSIAEVGQTPCYSFVQDIVYDSGLCYVAAQWGGVGIVNVHDPYNPYQISYFTPDTNNLFLTCMGLDKAGHYCYSAWGDSGLSVVDVSDSSYPHEVARVFPRWDSTGVRYVCSRDSLTYLSTDSGLVILNTSDPLDPQEIGRLRADSLEKLWVDGTRAYLAAGYLGLLVVDVSDPSQPESLGTYPVNLLEFVKDVWAQGNVAYLAYGKKFGYNRMVTTTHGVTALDVSDPNNITELGHYFFPPCAYGVFARGDTVFCARETGDIYVLRFTQGAVDETSDVEPEQGLCLSVSARVLRASFTSQGGPVSGAVYDPGGRLRLRLAQKSFEPGPASLELDISSLPAGVYILVLRQKANILSAQFPVLR